MDEKSAITHEFRRGKVDGDGSSLYTSFRHVNDILKSMDNKRLRSMVADYILKHPNLHLSVLQSGTLCKTVEEYCFKIKKQNLRGGEPEIRALSMLSHKLIRLVSKTKTAQNKYSINIFDYGEDIESFKECVYILYDQEKKHYDPLYVINKENSKEELRIFQRDDETVSELLSKFIQEELHDDTFIQLGGHNPTYEVGRPTETSLFNETKRIYDMIIANADMNFPIKRKLSGHASPSFATNFEQELSSPISNNNDDDFDKPTKFTKFDCESMTVEQHLQTDFSANDYIIAMSQQSTTDSSIISNQKHQELEMKFEVEPALKFRGRTSHEFIPLKARKRKGGPSEIRPPRYFADRNNHHYLKLLIPEKHLLAGLLRTCFEICLVTREINGYTYIHPYFVFQVHPTDRHAPYLNPIYRFLDNTTELTAYMDKLLKQLKLQLVVVMHKNKKLMETEQPLQVFPSPKNNCDGPAITTTYTSHRTFKDAYHLHDLRFAVTLWKKQPGEKVFRRYDDIQYISQISTEDKKYKITRK